MATPRRNGNATYSACFALLQLSNPDSLSALQTMPEHQSDSSPSRTTSSQLFSEPEWTRLLDYLSISGRQAEVLGLLIDGACDKQIAQELGISLPTIRTYLNRLYQRFDVSNRTSLVVEIFRQFRALEKPSSCSRK